MVDDLWDSMQGINSFRFEYTSIAQQMLNRFCFILVFVSELGYEKLKTL